MRPRARRDGQLSDQLADMLGRFQTPLRRRDDPAGDGVARARVRRDQGVEGHGLRRDDGVRALRGAPGLSPARHHARRGAPDCRVLGSARSLNDALALLSADSQPYNASQTDDQGNRIPIPGPANKQFNALIAAAHDELLYSTPDPVPAALALGTDGTTGRTTLSRPRTDLETLENLFYARNGAFGNASGSSTFIALRDPRGYAQVHPVNGAIPAPFVDADHDGLADVDALGRFVTSNGQPPPSPFFAVGDTYGTRDKCGRALRAGLATTGGDGGVSGAIQKAAAGDAGGAGDGGAGATSDAGSAPPASGDAGAPSPSACGPVGADYLLYDYLDTSHVFASSLMSDLKPLANPDPNAKHETLMYLLAGLPVTLGTRDGSPTTKKCYAPDPKNPTAVANCLDPNSLLSYDSYETKQSPMLDLVYAIGQMMGDPTIDDTLAYVSALFASHTTDVARLTGDGLAMKANANAHPEAKIPSDVDALGRDD